MDLINSLEKLTTARSHSYDSLPALMKIAGIEKGSKPEMVEALLRFYQDEQNLLRYWNDLSPFERDLLENYVRSSGVADLSEVRAIYEKHSVVWPPQSYLYRSEFPACLPTASPAKIFFVGRSIPDPLMLWLGQRIPPLPAIYHPVTEEEAARGEDQRLAIGNDFAEQLDRVVRTVNQSKLKTTPSGGMPTKASAIRIEEVFLHREPLPHWLRSMHDIQTVEETSLVYGTVQLMLAAKLLDNVGGYLVVGEGAETFMQLRPSGKCRLLLNAYVKSDRIDELSRNPEMKVRVKRDVPLVGCRETVLRYLADCPAEQWIQTAELFRYMKKTAHFFLERVVGEIEVYDEYDRFYYSGHDWEQVEGRLVETVLFEYLAPIGIVDVILNHVQNVFDTEFQSVLYFRITTLGAGLLGIREIEEPELASLPPDRV
ncbi:MAG: hypothetical protein K0R28_1225 [Paenibacillus sp.]|jgi:hypothetical protein|nr:hypothetical protein [Paenibacillus sp.]